MEYGAGRRIVVVTMVLYLCLVVVLPMKDMLLVWHFDRQHERHERPLLVYLLELSQTLLVLDLGLVLMIGAVLLLNSAAFAVVPIFLLFMTMMVAAVGATLSMAGLTRLGRLRGDHATWHAAWKVILWQMAKGDWRLYGGDLADAAREAEVTPQMPTLPSIPVIASTPLALAVPAAFTGTVWPVADTTMPTAAADPPKNALPAAALSPPNARDAASQNAAPKPTLVSGPPAVGPKPPVVAPKPPAVGPVIPRRARGTPPLSSSRRRRRQG